MKCNCASPAKNTPVSACKLTVLVDDAAMSDNYMSEHGVSIFVELPNGHCWLVDTGTTDVYLENARRMGVSLDNLTGIAVSHGHDDHTGGLTFYSRLKGGPPVYGHPYIWHKTYQVKAGEPVRICGMPYLARTSINSVFRPLNNTVKLDDDLYFLTDIPRAPGSHAPIKGNFFNEDGTGPCPLLDDATVVLRTSRGLIAIFGCAHAGYVNILKVIHKEFPRDKLLAAIGGLHLTNTNEDVLKEAVEYTAKFKAENFCFYGGHCTGSNAIQYFKSAFGEKAVQPMGSGRIIVFD